MKRGLVHILIFLFLALQWPHIHTHAESQIIDWPDSHEHLTESCHQCDWRQSSFDVSSEQLAFTISDGWQQELNSALYNSPVVSGFEFRLENKGPPLVF
jgi:hypothetical protein